MKLSLKITQPIIIATLYFSLLANACAYSFSNLFFLQHSFQEEWSGLGQSETFYSWAVTMFSFGDMLGALVAGKLTHYISYRLSFLLGLSLCVVGHILYFLTNQHQVWMILVARFIIGLHVGCITVLVCAYIGETAPEELANQPQLDSNHCSKAGSCRKHKNTLKDKLFVFTSFVTTITYMSASGKVNTKVYT